MADLRINKIDTDLLAQLKKDAIDAGRTLRDHVIFILRKVTRSTQRTR